MHKFEQAPVGDGGGKGSSTEGVGLADASMADVQDAGKQTMSDGAAGAIGKSSDFEFTNEDGNAFKTDDKGKVSSFDYRDENGDSVGSFTDIKRDDKGAVTGFTDSQGKAWEQLPADPTSPLTAEQEGLGWNYTNAETGESERSAVDLGNVTIDEKGVKADGQNADYLTIPEE